MIETRRLVLREFTETDTPAIYELVSNSEVMRFSDGVESMEEASARLAEYRHSYIHRGFGKWAVEEKEEGKVIGYCGFGVEEFDGEAKPELGFRLLPQFWGQGIATEAALACSEYGFTDLGFSSYLGFTQPMNLASRAVLEKIGMMFIRHGQFHGYPIAIYEKENEV